MMITKYAYDKREERPLRKVEKRHLQKFNALKKLILGQKT